MINKKIFYISLLVLIVIIGIGIISYFNLTNIPSSEGKVIVKNWAGEAMLAEVCWEKGYIEETSDYIIEGEILSSETKWVENVGSEGKNIYTYSEFKINTYIKGEPLEHEMIQIVTMGGCIGGMCESVEDGPIMTTGKKRLYITASNGEFGIHGCGGIITLESAPLPQGDCTEDDTGFDINTKAITKGLGGKLFYKGTFLKEGYHEVEDYCYNDDPSTSSSNGNHLKEYVCSEGRITFGDYECNCENGRCIN